MRTKIDGELSLLERIRRRAKSTGTGLRLGIGDDCALLRLHPAEELAVTTDLSIAGRHFRLNWHPSESVGHRTLARGLSDLAAMGARPVAAFLSLGLPRELTIAHPRRKSRPQSPWIEGFLNGFLTLADLHNAPLAGGDLAESPVAVADIVLAGAVPRGRALLRSGARPGDLLYVTGKLGGASAGLQGLAKLMGGRGASRGRIPPGLQDSLAPHLYPQPRIVQGIYLQKRQLANAAIDLSDGLSTDLSHICAESGVFAEIDAAAIPIHPDATLDQALHGGEDYELLFSASPSARVPRAIAGVPITRIGRVLRTGRKGPSVTLITSRGSQPLDPAGWQHFS